MKNLLKKARKLHDDISSEVIKRENIFSSRSEDWQESVKGDEYSVKTDCLRELAEMIDEGLSAIE